MVTAYEFGEEAQQTALLRYFAQTWNRTHGAAEQVIEARLVHMIEPTPLPFSEPAESTKFELVAGGFRNPLDVAFNEDGEMFTFDADMEWDVGLSPEPTWDLRSAASLEYASCCILSKIRARKIRMALALFLS